MPIFVKDKVIVVTGAAGGFGQLISLKAARLGAKLVCGDIDAAGLEATLVQIRAQGGLAESLLTDVTSLEQMKALAEVAIATFGRIDVMINNVGVMPLAFWADHAAASALWVRRLDINIKGVMNGIIAVYDPMIAQGRGHVINISSTYGNFPVAGAGIYGATKAAVNFLSESLRVESQGRIKVTTIRPTGVPATGLGGGVVNPAAIVGILGQNTGSYLATLAEMTSGEAPPEQADPASITYAALEPGFIADAVIHAIAQPWGVSIGDITIRASGDGYVL